MMTQKKIINENLKMEEQILVIDREGYEQKISDILEMKVPQGAYFTDRGPAETDETKLQIIPYVVLTDPEHKQVLLATRTKQGNEKRLHLKKSLGIGGHLNEEDICDGSFKQGIHREICEETGITPDEIQALRPAFHILDDGNPVGRVHIGACFVGIVDAGVLYSACLHQDQELVRQLVSPAEVISDHQEHLEGWSQRLIPLLEKWAR